MPIREIQLPSPYGDQEEEDSTQRKLADAMAFALEASRPVGPPRGVPRMPVPGGPRPPVGGLPTPGPGGPRQPTGGLPTGAPGPSFTPGAVTAGGLPAGWTDRDLLAAVLTGEGRGEQDMRYIADVIGNRVASDAYPGSLADVILQPAQFSALNAITGGAGGAGANEVWRNPSETAYRVADAFLGGQGRGLTGGALNYYHPGYANPAWGGSHFRSLPGSPHIFGHAR